MIRRLATAWLPLTLIAAAALAAVACGGGAQQQAPPAAVEQAQPPAQQSPAQQAEPAAPPAAAPAEQPPVVAQSPKPTRKPAPKPQGEEAGRTTAPPPVTAAEPPPPPEPLIKTVPAGTAIEVAFLDGVSSKSSQAGDSFRARVAKDVVEDGIVVIPAGSVVVGSVVEAVSLKKIGGQAKLALEFNKLELTSGRSAPISASFAETGKSETGKDAATIGGATAGGAVLGRMLSKGDKGKGTVLGAIVGAAAGTAIASKTKGEEVEILAGTAITLKLDRAAQITVRP
jgi:hypothetical protein